MFTHISGFKRNGSNFANMFGSMEEMKYLAGMIAGARAKGWQFSVLAISPLPNSRGHPLSECNNHGYAPHLS